MVQRAQLPARNCLRHAFTVSYSYIDDEQKAGSPPKPRLIESTRALRNQVRERLSNLTPHENIYTIPNILTFSRLLATPVIGYLVLHDNHAWAVGLFAYAGITDFIDGWIARRWKLQTVVGSVIDPMADKFLMTVLVGCLAVKGAIPRMSPVYHHHRILLILLFSTPSMAGSCHFWSRHVTRIFRHLLPLRIASRSQDFHALLGLFNSFCRSPSNHCVQMEHLSPARADRLYSRHSSVDISGHPLRQRHPDRTAEHAICRGGDHALERCQLSVSQGRSCDSWY